MTNKTYLELSDAEISDAKKLTPKEQAAVDVFITAAKSLPKSLCVAIDDDLDGQHLRISKRTTRGSCSMVAFLRKKSLVF